MPFCKYLIYKAFYMTGHIDVLFFVRLPDSYFMGNLTVELAKDCGRNSCVFDRERRWLVPVN